MTKIKTQKGTELPLMEIKGKVYLQVMHRLVWFREEHPQGRIETMPHTISPQISIFRARISDKDGNLLAEATKSETPQGFQDYIEKAETGAVGRALAMCGYGTQFTDDLDEGARIVDSPAPQVTKVRDEERPQGFGVNPVKPKSGKAF